MVVTNQGKIYSGKEVVQVYICPPQDRAAKEYRKLAGFGKTGVLLPGESKTMEIDFPVSSLAYFDENAGAWVIEKGIYGVFAGRSISDSFLAGSIQVEDDIIIAKTEHVCPLRGKINELEGDAERSNSKRDKWLGEISGKPAISIKQEDVVSEEYVYSPSYEDMSREVRAFVDTLTEEQLILLATGNIGRRQEAAIGSAGIRVPGSAGETSGCALEQGLAPIALADGPAGLRLNQTYRLKDG